MSEGASLVFLGLRAPQEGEPPEDYAAYYSGLMARVEGISAPVTGLVLAAEDIDFRRVFD